MRTRSSRARIPEGSLRDRWRRRGERGTSAVEFAIVTPVFLLLILVIIEGGLYFHARNTAQSAAREGVSYLRLGGANSDPQAFVAAAEDVTEGYAREIGRLDSVTAVGTLDQATGRVRIRVTGEVVLPVGGRVEIEQTSVATLEQWLPDLRESP